MTISQEDILEFEQMLDAMPHAHAKHLATWLNWKILAQIDRNAEAEKQWVEALAELDNRDAIQRSVVSNAATLCSQQQLATRLK